MFIASPVSGDGRKILQNKLEYVNSLPGKHGKDIALFAFNNVAEVLQILGFIVAGNELYINPCSDFAYSLELNGDIRVDHKSEPKDMSEPIRQIITRMDIKGFYDFLLCNSSNPEELETLLNNFIELGGIKFNAKANHTFLEMLHKIYW